MRATARLSSFSGRPPWPTAPASGPPWPASITMSAVFSMCPSASLTHSLFSQGVTTWAQPPLTASTPMATPDRMRPVTGPPGWAASAAPLSPAVNAPDAATWWLATGSDVATGRVVVDAAAWVVTVVAGADDADVADEDGADAGGADV